MRDSMIIYRSFHEAIKTLPLERQGEVWNAVFEYGMNGIIVDLEGLSSTVFTLIRPQLDANIKKYKNGCKGGRKKNLNETKKEPKRNLNESKTKANDNVNVNDNDNIPHFSRPKLDINGFPIYEQ
jgi:hypothetical protein